MTPPRRLVVGDLAELRWTMEPALHPSTATVAFVASGYDPDTDALGYDLFLRTPDEMQLVEHDARNPRWSPTGDRIAYLRRSDSRWIPACRTLAGDEVELSPPPGDATMLDWASDDERILVLTSETPESDGRHMPYPVESSGDWTPPPRRTAWIVKPGRETHSLEPLTGDVSYARWSPDGSRIAFVSDQGVDRDISLATGLWLHTVGTHDTECLVPAVTPIRALAWSPDGTRIAFVAAARDNAASAISELWVVDIDDGVGRRLAAERDRSIGSPVRGDDERAIGPPILEWTPDSAAVLAIYAQGGRSRLARFDLDGGWEDLIVDERCVLEFSSGPAGIAFSWSDPVTPGEITLRDPNLDRQLTDVGGLLLSDVELAHTTRVSVTASDGVEVEGWLTLPDRPTGAPLVLQVHGGPHYPVGERFSFDAQRLAAQGLAVLRANPRGSHGYGQAFADGNLADWGGRDFQDLLDLVDEAVRYADLDTDRVAVMGESYGGYMAAWAVASSDRFAAAVVENGIADFLSSAGGAVGPTFWHSELGGAPWENPQLYLDRSVIARSDRVTVPVLVIHCEADTTCPVAHGEAIHAALRQLGREVTFLRVPGEGHFFNVFGALSRRIERTATLDQFLVRQLRASSVLTFQREELRS
ncbi:MAG TPA: S9 family peptidase [Acidimicrobiia bacterium]|nr:S9 family peptidase [Acidimicrobiia bacterium]